MTKKRRTPEVSGAAVASHLESLPEEAMSELASTLRAQAHERGFLLQKTEGEQAMIPLALTPWVISPAAARYLQVFFRGIRRTVNRILGHYFEDTKLQEILPLSENELRWLKASCSDGIPRLQTIFERFDTNLGLSVEEELDSFQLIEFNSVGVGCIYLMPAATEILQAQLLPRLSQSHPALHLAPPADYRKLLLEELKSHSKAIDQPACRLALVERREAVHGGVDEFTEIARFFKAQEIPTVQGDPREVEQVKNQFFLKGEPVDVVYRDFQLEEVVSIKTHGGSVEGIEAAFAENRVVSTMFGEFDHKSLCELLSNPDFSHYLKPEELRAARRRVPWTRLIAERHTTGLKGEEVDLLQMIRANRPLLVLKPNRGYGGEGVIVGQEVSASEWEGALNRAMEKPKGWVVQERVPISKAKVLILNDRGRPKLEEHFLLLGVTATSRGVAFVGRCADQAVVNISQGGALVPVFLSP